ncbi:arylamine N-acetyltransferase family protein [Streptomyces poonensis]|uniref:N-hydroxyarylamine O-acetyltransferase n=1 Tax=Streptomyces poonensis TaxID=68255 RepID=A0A918PPM8_9ACTN|nr:arylamine N-acetyltransferase [Streptomyces poonensis]GGZ18605.1 N-hydroxyarylamine O-acetyltransferase [Streptomyces poonensis]GLJ90618.1 N-hydroxyarylamine O-acetyltransferase [Streptomyces poonensis]
MNSAQADAYLRRIGAERPAGPTVDALSELHVRHLCTVPFENLSIHLGEEIVLEEERLLDKVVGARRGGFCYELNGAFAALLRRLGFEVTLLAGRVFKEDGRLGIPYDHLALRVRTADGGDWLADVGFGAHSHFPLALAERGEQRDPAGTFQVVEAGLRAGGEKEAGEYGDLDVLRDGKPQYRLEVRPRELGDFVTGAWWHSTSPVSHFGQSLVCSRQTEDGGRITLSGRRFTVTAPGGGREVTELVTDKEVLTTYSERFGLRLARVPEVRGA